MNNVNFFFFYGKRLFYSSLLLLGIILLIGRYYSQYKLNLIRKNSEIYQFNLNMLNSNKFIENMSRFSFKKNIYGSLTALNLAKKYVINNEFHKAEIILKNNLPFIHDKNIIAIYRLYIARLQLQQNNISAALITLNKINDSSWKKNFIDVQGDIILREGKIEKAKKTWSEGINITSSLIMISIMQMKINQLL
ncbi:MAG: tetratricopeptide repeat protein [Candidatus Dasytiphilus stammeri]